MGGYEFPGQIVASDGSEGNGALRAGFIILDKPTVAGSIRVSRVHRTEEATDSTRVETESL